MLLYLFYNFIFELADVCKIIFKIIFYLPFRILHIALKLPTREAIALIKSDVYHYVNQLKSHGLIFTVHMEENKPKITVQSYGEQMNALADAVNRGRHESTAVFLRDVLTAINQCRYAVIDDGETDLRFIQYRIDTGSFIFDFPMCPENSNAPYSGEIIALLRKLGFKKYNEVIGYSFLYKTYTIYSESDTMCSITANFGNNLNLAVRFSAYIFNRIYKSTWVPTVTFG